MDFIKTNETFTRTYNEAGEAAERKDTAQFRLIDPDGQPIGEAHINTSSANININISGFNTIDEGLEKIKTLFGVTE